VSFSRLPRVLAVVVTSAFLLGGIACSSDDGAPDSNVPPSAPTTAASNAFGSGGNLQGGGSIAQAVTDIPGIVEDVQASIVAIQITAANGAEGAGSGVIWDDDGVIVTNNHVVEGARELTVVLLSGERLPATFRASDPLTDLAIIEVDRDGLTPAEFTDNLPVVGELALAMGTPLGFENSVTAGIISGLHRSIPSGGTTPALVDLIQTDASISPGNSGGALVNGRGEVMAINVAYIPPAEGAVAIGFGIPSPTVREVVEQLLENGRAEHAFLGLVPRPLTKPIAAQLGLSTDRGVFVFQVTPGSAADEGRIVEGDVIVRFDGKDIESVEDLFAALRERKPGDRIDIEVKRGDDDVKLTATLDSRPAEQ
jgi:serine protease DegQ